MLLERINQPDDLKALTVGQLNELAAEIRQFLIEKLSVTGGHLAPNLGVVELTIALHYYLNSPHDKIIFDVGHQSYVHKILTGRRDRFDTLKKYKGLCGYIKRSESIHDVWEAGHSSTSLSAAMGMAMARDYQGENFRIAAVIGDGAMTGGMAFEALNHIGHEKKKLMVILNDNEMSISQNVGAIHNYLGKIRSGKHYRKAKEEVEQILKRIPAIGGTLAKTIERLKDSLKYMLVDGVLFEELGYTYFGPIDGHNIPLLLDTLQQADQVDGPSLIHVITVKGKGYKPAEKDSSLWHGITPYKIESGELLQGSGMLSFSDIFAETLTELGERDPRIVAVTAAMAPGTSLSKFGERFPDRLIDVGIAEQHATTLCGALADAGMKPVFGVYSTFLQRGYDQLVHDVARQNLNVIFAIDRAGFVGADGETHQGVYDIAYIRHVPNMVLMMPKDENELRHMVKTAIDYNGGPIAFRYPRMNALGVPLDQELKAIPIGSWETIEDGQDAAIIAIGPMVQLAREAAAKLRTERIHARVINARFIKPMDVRMLDELAGQGLPMLVVEEAAQAGGLGSAVLEYYAEHAAVMPRVRLMGIPDQFIEHGSIKEQRAEVGLTVDNIVERVRDIARPRRRSGMTARLAAD
jgi:1-deoxy-D-xylulose-5-phosphate synthase